MDEKRAVMYGAEKGSTKYEKHYLKRQKMLYLAVKQRKKGKYKLQKPDSNNKYMKKGAKGKNIFTSDIGVIIISEFCPFSSTKFCVTLFFILFV